MKHPLKAMIEAFTVNLQLLYSSYQQMKRPDCHLCQNEVQSEHYVTRSGRTIRGRFGTGPEDGIGSFQSAPGPARTLGRIVALVNE